jgi:iron-sulfur cluster repair protein YtfE (RIC family)
MNLEHTAGPSSTVTTPLADWLIRDLVEAYPELLTVLGPMGIDLCCGGGHPLGEALDLHGIDRASVLPRIVSIVEASDRPIREARLGRR